MDRNKIEHQVSEIVYEILHDKKVLSAEYFDTPLTGNLIQCSDRELLYIALEIMIKFHVKLLAKDVENYGFNTISSIADIIYNKQIL